MIRAAVHVLILVIRVCSHVFQKLFQRQNCTG